MNYVDLHVHSVYSVYDGLNTPQELVAKAAELGQPGIALTDHGQLGGILKLKEACKKSGIKPITGIENYCVENLVEIDSKTGKRIKQKNAHVILLAKNTKGYKNILRLNYLANQKDHFWYKPLNTFDELFKYSEDVIVGSACIASGFSNLMQRGLYEEAEKLFITFTEVFKENFYAEIQINEIEEQKVYNSWLMNQANKHGVPIVLTSDAHYIDGSGAEIQKFSFDLRKEDDKEVGEEFQCHHLYLHTIDDFKRLNKEFGFNYTDEQIETWCDNSVDIANKIDFVLPERDRMFLPRQAFDEDERFMELTKQGIMEYFQVDNYEDVPQEYKDRIRTELDLIIRKGLCRYLLTLWDIFKFIKDKKISVGCGRGSAGGSLVLCALGITKWALDPLKQGLIFERFVSRERLPDQIIDYYATT